MIIWPLPRLDPGSGGVRLMPFEVQSVRWAVSSLSSLLCLGTRDVVCLGGCGGNFRPGRWRCQAPGTLSDHLGNEAEALKF